MSLPSPAILFASLLFGIVGLAAFTYGKKSANWKPMAIGVLLMIYPYAIDEAWLVYAIGVALCVALFVFRE